MTEKQRLAAIEKERKAKVAEYKKAIDNMEEDDKLFYENQLKRQKISNEQYAESLKAKSERYAQYSKDVLNVSYMTEQERYDLSREYMQKSEKALTEHMQRMNEIARTNLNSKMENSMEYISDRDYYSNWQDFDDDPVSAFKRVDKNLSEKVFSGDISLDEYRARLEGFGSFMYKDRVENSNRWLAHESEMNRLSAEDYIAGLERMKAYTQEYYSSGMISHREYIDGMQSLEERIFEKKKEQHQQILQQAEEEKRAVEEAAKAKIASLEEEYNAKIAAMDKDKRGEELSELKALERVYSNAQTKEGKERLGEIRERIDDINDANRRAALKEDLQESKKAVYESSQRKKDAIDRSASRQALGLGLYYDESSGYKMLSDVKGTLSSVLSEQESFSSKSFEEMTLYSTELSRLMSESTQNLAGNILTSFSAFASGVEAIKNQIFADVEAVNSLDFSRFGTSGKAIKTSVTYNDYGDKNISGVSGASDYFSHIGNLIAKGGRL